MSHIAIIWNWSRAGGSAQSVKRPEVCSSHMPHVFLPQCHHYFLHHVSSPATCCQAPLPVFQGFARGLSHCSICHMCVHILHQNLNHMMNENTTPDQMNRNESYSHFCWSVRHAIVVLLGLTVSWLIGVIGKSRCPTSFRETNKQTKEELLLGSDKRWATNNNTNGRKSVGGVKWHSQLRRHVSE